MWARIQQLGSSVGGRISLGFAAFGALFWLLFDPKSLPTDWEKIVGVFVAAGAWLWAEIASHKSGPHAEDVALWAKLRARFTDQARVFLREHNFGNSFPRQSLGGFADFDREWIGAAYEFHDKQMQAALAGLTDAVGTFDGHLALTVRPLTGNPALLTTKTVQDENVGERSAQTLADIAQLNLEAQAAIQALDGIERLAKKRLRAS